MRILEATASQFRRMSSSSLLEAIRLSEGRTIVAEVICSAQPLVDGVSNVELAAAFGADMILLNFYDVLSPSVQGLPTRDGVEAPGAGATAADAKRMIGRPVGINLEPGPSPNVSPGRMATADNAERALGQGVDFVVITGNPHTGVTNQSVLGAVDAIRNRLGDSLILVAGRMHSAGAQGRPSEAFVSVEDVKALARAGADVILLPAPGTVPGMTVEKVGQLVAVAHGEGVLATSSVGTSQEGADPPTIRDIALYSKMAGVDIHHIGDSGFSGIAAPENIMAYSIAVRGRRHTYRRMALSPLR